MSLDKANPSGSKRVGKEYVVSQETVASVDGTPIAYWRSGDGPPLILVHGSFDDHNVWAPVLPAFEVRFTVYAVDRRGRGGSGDGTGHSLESEAADIAEVVESIGGQEEVNLLGHSYGGVCALEAAGRTTHVRRLVLYEPAVPAGIAFFPPGVIDRIEELVGKASQRRPAPFSSVTWRSCLPMCWTCCEMIPVGRRAWRRPTPCRARCVP